MLCGTTCFLAALWLTAAIAARVAEPEHTVEELEPVAAAGKAHA
jgi:hypothetical protein